MPSNPETPRGIDVISQARAFEQPAGSLPLVAPDVVRAQQVPAEQFPDMIGQGGFVQDVHDTIAQIGPNRRTVPAGQAIPRTRERPAAPPVREPRRRRNLWQLMRQHPVVTTLVVAVTSTGLGAAWINRGGNPNNSGALPSPIIEPSPTGGLPSASPIAAETPRGTIVETPAPTPAPTKIPEVKSPSPSIEPTPSAVVTKPPETKSPEPTKPPETLAYLRKAWRAPVGNPIRLKTPTGSDLVYYNRKPAPLGAIFTELNWNQEYPGLPVQGVELGYKIVDKDKIINVIGLEDKFGNRGDLSLYFGRLGTDSSALVVSGAMPNNVRGKYISSQELVEIFNSHKKQAVYFTMYGFFIPGPGRVSFDSEAWEKQLPLSKKLMNDLIEMRKGKISLKQLAVRYPTVINSNTNDSNFDKSKIVWIFEFGIQR